MVLRIVFITADGNCKKKNRSESPGITVKPPATDSVDHMTPIIGYQIKYLQFFISIIACSAVIVGTRSLRVARLCYKLYHISTTYPPHIHHTSTTYPPHIHHISTTHLPHIQLWTYPPHMPTTHLPSLSSLRCQICPPNPLHH
ncbi:unnamed protein product [Candidula unifasciata]|uniref:Uncharacterized protein n=1 Tax=Candidula unifasciata TaxID=100452 RepID=A0A8S3ZTF2_9EUPU|nr:unnamed protein product [Candidula unifasciata]